MKIWKKRKIYTNFLAHSLTISKRSTESLLVTASLPPIGNHPPNLVTWSCASQHSSIPLSEIALIGKLFHNSKDIQNSATAKLNCTCKKCVTVKGDYTDEK
jgi:hypothetical protein